LSRSSSQEANTAMAQSNKAEVLNIFFMGLFLLNNSQDKDGCFAIPYPKKSLINSQGSARASP
jgi:hypothetical protein